jgi:MoaA/NifB/PqqE/SkfB family radical SAM enzyme
MRKNEYPYVVNKFMAYGHKHHIPLLATFELTYRCNLKCIHCYITDDDPYQEEMPVDSWIQTIHELKEIGAIYI